MNTISSEWTKFWSVRSTWWCLISGLVLMLAYSGALGLAANSGVERSMAPHAVVTGAAFYLTQFAVVALATLFITSEYASGSIRSTLQWVPTRNRVLAAKSAVLLPVLFGYGVLNTLAGVAISAPLIPGRNSSVGEVLATSAGMGGYFALLGLLCLGLGTALRSTAGTIVTVFVLLVMIPMFAGSLGGEDLVNYFPGFAGVNAMVTSGEPNPIFGGVAPYAPWVGIALCTAWAAAGLATGSTVLRRRDA
ncbi:ABC transporter permease [Amycolatopsis regifaucium]|uniref:ABC transporter permease n=1 Tax=Amycolatopsis regifaucium TaxID=546365 RepID=A0A154MRX3_9PSEU|nr:ABC transporter permease [Amycolatopsis regifaucium]KZB86840.1 ABC transporter permease [Amycolatopsis regifaucium]OKA09271.1 ABC transporter permease [Amycolatopsis regifaucium]SFH57213.1 ABC-2 type transport system permease protein [Amycolatopsis regifaucium]